jgi:hypothetical protein
MIYSFLITIAGSCIGVCMGHWHFRKALSPQKDTFWIEAMLRTEIRIDEMQKEIDRLNNLIAIQTIEKEVRDERK